MITNYDKDLAVVDTKWLNEVGTAYAVAYYKNECHKLIVKYNNAEEQKNRISQILDESNMDEDLELDDLVSVSIELYLDKLKSLLKDAENRLFAINGQEWIDATVSETAWQQIGSPTPITKDQFENDWKKTEAGY